MAEDVRNINAVHLRGSLADRAERKAGWGEGDWFVFRLVIQRAPDAPGQHRGQAVDVLTVRAPATEHLSHVIEGLQPGDVVDVRGQIERRHWRTSAGTATATEVAATTVAKRDPKPQPVTTG